MFDKLSTTKGIGKATIEKLEKAGLDDAMKIVNGGMDALKAAGLNSSIAQIVYDVATANLPATADDEKSGVEDAGSTETVVVEVVPVTQFPDTTLGQAMAAAAKKKGTTVAAIAAALPQAPAKPEVPATKHEPKPKGPQMRPLNLGIEKPFDFTDPTQVIRDHYDRLPGGEVPADALFIVNAYPRCPMCHAEDKHPKMTIDDVMVLVIHYKQTGKSRSATFCKDHINVAKAQADRAFSANKDVVVEVVELREAWRRLTRGFKRDIAAAREQRELQQRVTRRNTALEAFVAELDNVDSPFWLTEAQVGSFESPLSVPVLTFGLTKEEAQEVGGILPTQHDTDKFEAKWAEFFHHYGVELILHPPADVAQHLDLVGGLRNRAKQHGALPYLPLMIIRRHFQGHGMRYVVVHDAVLQDLINLHLKRTRFEAKASPLATDWLTRRWLVRRESVKQDADVAFKSTPGGMALDAFLTAPLTDETAAKDATHLVSGAKRR